MAIYLRVSGQFSSTSTLQTSSAKSTPSKAMASNQSSFGDPVLLDKIDRLIKLGVGEYVSLPQLVVVGDQSSGKSSVLEGLTELPFPRDSTLCTRFATRIVFRRAPDERVAISILPAASSDPARTRRLREWKVAENNMTTLTMVNFKKILDSVSWDSQYTQSKLINIGM
jgi:Dynamin family